MINSFMLNSCIKFELRKKKKKKTPIYRKSFNRICSTIVYIDNVNSSFAAELGVKLLMAITLHMPYETVLAVLFASLTIKYQCIHVETKLLCGCGPLRI